MCMYVYFDSVVHYTSYVNNVRQIKEIQIHPEPRPTPESLEDCGWLLSNSGWPKLTKYCYNVASKSELSTVCNVQRVLRIKMINVAVEYMRLATVCRNKHTERFAEFR